MLGFFLSILLFANNFIYNDASADRLIRQSMQSTYTLQLVEARSAANSLKEKYPDHPAGYTLLAETYWWEAQMDPRNQKIVDSYYSTQKQALEKGEAALESGKYPKIEITAYVASAHGSYSRFKVTQEEAYFAALRAGLRAHKYAEQVYEMDKSYYDIYVGIGAFNFFSGSLPAVIKPFAWLFGARGDRNLGIEQLKTAMTKARYSQTEARIVYYTAMLSDKNWAEAWRTLERLRADYKDNFVLYTWATDWFRQQSKNLAGAEHFEKVFNEESKRSPLMAKNALLEKAYLLNAERRTSDVIATIDRLKALPGGDALINKKVQALEKTLRK
jgi:hypothetical protein